MDLEFEMIPYERNDKLPWCQIFDLDGTLAIKGDRDIFDFSKVGVDIVNTNVACLTTSVPMNTLNHADYIIIMSGRPDLCKDQTEYWLNDSEIYFDDLFMRKDGDYRDDTIVKYALFNEHIRGKYNVRFIVDDRPKVCRMWRKLGLTVLQVGDPYIEF